VFRSSLSTYIGRTHRLVGTYARDQPTNQLTKRVCQHIHHSLQWLEHLKIHPGSPAPSYAWGAQGQLSHMHFPSLRHLFRALNCAQTFFCDGGRYHSIKREPNDSMHRGVYLECRHARNYSSGFLGVLRPYIGASTLCLKGDNPLTNTGCLYGRGRIK